MSELLKSLCDCAPSFSGGGHGEAYLLPAECDLTQVREIILQRAKGLRCTCSSLWGNVQCDLPLLSTKGHLILRHGSQWECVFGPEFVPIFTMNGSNEILLSHETVIDTVHGFYQSPIRSRPRRQTSRPAAHTHAGAGERGPGGGSVEHVLGERGGTKCTLPKIPAAGDTTQKATDKATLGPHGTSTGAAGDTAMVQA